MPDDEITIPWPPLMDRPPAPGTVTFDKKGQKFTVVRASPHVRLDGTPTSLVTWSSHCHICSAPYTFRTGMRNAYLTRTCTVHRARRIRKPRTLLTGCEVKS